MEDLQIENRKLKNKLSYIFDRLDIIYDLVNKLRGAKDYQLWDLITSLEKETDRSLWDWKNG